VSREAVIAEAVTWLGTPYHHHGRIKGVGADCAMFPVEVYAAAGILAQDPDIGPYPAQWHLHHDEERYLAAVRLRAAEIDGPPSPGDFAVWKFGRCFSHGGIVIAWPRIIHALMGVGVVLDDAAINQTFRHADGSPREVRFFSLFGEEPTAYSQQPKSEDIS